VLPGRPGEGRVRSLSKRARGFGRESVSRWRSCRPGSPGCRGRGLPGKEVIHPPWGEPRRRGEGPGRQEVQPPSRRRSLGARKERGSNSPVLAALGVPGRGGRSRPPSPRSPGPSRAKSAPSTSRTCTSGGGERSGRRRTGACSGPAKDAGGATASTCPRSYDAFPGPSSAGSAGEDLDQDQGWERKSAPTRARLFARRLEWSCGCSSASPPGSSLGGDKPFLRLGAPGPEGKFTLRHIPRPWRALSRSSIPRLEPGCEHPRPLSRGERVGSLTGRSPPNPLPGEDLRATKAAGGEARREFPSFYRPKEACLAEKTPETPRALPASRLPPFLGPFGGAPGSKQEREGARFVSLESFLPLP
jgi:hypothetical protein